MVTIGRKKPCSTEDALRMSLRGVSFDSIGQSGSPTRNSCFLTACILAPAALDGCVCSK